MAKKNIPIRPMQPKPAAKTNTATPAISNGWEPAGWLTPILIVLAITAICYWPSIPNEYVNWDDTSNITENENLVVTNAESLKNIFSLDKGNVIGNYNPLSIATFYLEKKFQGDFNPKTTHFINLLLHLGVVFFAFRLLLHMGIGKWGAFVGGLLMGIHPMRVESVAWATERKDVLFALFFFAALMFYVRWIKTEDAGQKTRLYILMIVLAALSCLSKVQAVTLPLSMLVLDFWFKRELNFQRILEKTPFWLLSLATGLANIYTLRVAGSTDDTLTNYTFGHRLLVGTYSFCVYLFKLLVPHPMSPMYPYERELPWLAYVSPLGFFAVGYLVWRLWQSGTGKVWIVGILFFFFNVMFVLQVFGAGQGYLADRFTYVPYFGFFFIAAYGYDQYTANPEKSTNINIGVGLVFLAFAFLTYRQIGVWKNGGTLWTHVIEQEGRSIALAYGNRANYSREKATALAKNKGNVATVKDLYDKAAKDYTEAINISPDKSDQYNSRGKTYFDMAMSGLFKGQEKELVSKAIGDYTKGLSFKDMKPKTRGEIAANRGAAMAASGNIQKSLEDFSVAIENDPNNKNAYLNRSLAYFNLGQYDKAIGDYTSYLNIAPYDAAIYYERGMCRRIVGKDLNGALQDLNQALQLKPSEALAYMERARVYFLMNNIPQAQQDARKAKSMGVQIDPTEAAKYGL